VSSDLKYWDVFRDPKWLLENLLKKYKVIRVQTTGWSTSNVGSGVVTQYPTYITMATGTTASSRGLATTSIYGPNPGNAHYYFTDWRKKLMLEFICSKGGNDPESVARIQLKEAATEGALAQRGVGIEIDNYSLVGEAYGTARGTVSLVTLSDSRLVRVTIEKLPDRVNFYVNGILYGTLTGSAVPNVVGNATTELVVSIVNGPTGGVQTGFIWAT
jgi:hypothetical protein